jgi:hypothetical protein
VQAHGAEPFVEPAGAGIRFVHPEVQAGGRSRFRKLGDELAHQAAAKTMSLVLGKDVQVVEHRAPELIVVANGKPESDRRALLAARARRHRVRWARTSGGASA